MNNIRWFEEWGWEPLRFKITLLGLLIAPVLAFPVVFVVWGLETSLFLGIAFLFAFFYAITYGPVGWKVNRTRQNDANGTDSVDCLIVQGWLQSPGTAILKDATLVLRPIVGATITVNLGNVASIREVSYFNGHFYFTKTGFWLNLSGGQRYGVAVAKSIAERWRPVLMNPSHTPGMHARPS